MNPKYLAELVFKVVGVVAIIQSIRMLPDVLSLPAWNFGQGGLPAVNMPLLILSQTIPFLILLTLGFTLVVKSKAFAQATVRDSVESEIRVTAADVHSILFSTVGILLIGISVVNLPSIIHNFAVFYSEFGRQVPVDQTQLAGSWFWLLGTVLQIGIGVGLVFKGSTLATLLRRRFDRAQVISADGRCPHCGHWFESKDYRAGASAYLCSNCKQELPRKLVAPERPGTSLTD